MGVAFSLEHSGRLPLVLTDYLLVQDSAYEYLIGFNVVKSAWHDDIAMLTGDDFAQGV